MNILKQVADKHQKHFKLLQDQEFNIPIKYT